MHHADLTAPGAQSEGHLSKEVELVTAGIYEEILRDRKSGMRHLFEFIDALRESDRTGDPLPDSFQDRFVSRDESESTTTVTRTERGLRRRDH
jgi:hypothetical protein